MKKTTKIIIYILHAFAACTLFLYLLFPSDTFKEVMKEKLAQTHSGIEVHTDTIRPTLAPGLSLKPFSLYADSKPLFSSEKVQVSPHLLSLIRDTKIFSFKGPLGSGHFAGRAELIQSSKRTQQFVKVDLNEIPLEAIALFKQWPNYAPFGTLDGQLTFDSLKGGSGRVDSVISIAPIRIVINPPFMGLGSLEFTELQAEISATQRQLTIKKCQAFGAQLEVKVTGFIALRHPLGSSRPTLSLTVKPQPAFIADHKNDMIGGLLSSDKAQQRGIVFQISGTLDNPSYVIR